MTAKKTLSGARLKRWLRQHNRLARALKRALITVKVAVLKAQRKKLSARVIALAGHYVGVKEYPAGTNLTMFGKWFGENGVPWCAIFVSFILSKCGKAFKMAFVPAIVATAIAKKAGLSVIEASAVNRAIAAGHPVLACFDWTHDGTADHVGIAVHVDLHAGVVHTIEGNTGDADWSNGGEVLREERPLSLVQAFVKVA